MMRKNAEHIIVILGGPETIFEEEHILALWTLFLIKGNYNNCNNESLTMLIHFWIKMPSFSSVRQAPGLTANNI